MYIKNLRDSCIDFLKNENTKKEMQEMIKPIFGMIYNEIYVYVWIIAICHIFFVVMLLSMFVILLQLLNKHKMKEMLLAKMFQMN